MKATNSGPHDQLCFHSDMQVDITPLAYWFLNVSFIHTTKWYTKYFKHLSKCSWHVCEKSALKLAYAVFAEESSRTVKDKFRSTEKECKAFMTA